jgi:hypothetical protein
VIKRGALILIAMLAVLSAGAKQLNDKLLNRPYADLKPWHLGFSVGIHSQDVTFTHNGLVTADGGESWYMEQPSYSPGFCVNALIDFRLNTYFNLRVSPGLYFGNRVVKMHDFTTEATTSQNIKSTMVVAPIDLKYSSVRYRNSRPYLTAGVMPTYDVSKHGSSEMLQFKPLDCFLTFGMGCDFYLPFFKFIPEVKFCFGLSDVLRHDRSDLADDPGSLKYTESLSRAVSKMIVVTFYFE